MLSNLGPKSNLIEDCSEKCLSRLSAIDLHKVGQITRRYFFDERIRYQGLGLPTTRQNREWDDRLFWGEHKISLKTNNRNIKWVVEWGEKMIPRWIEYRSALDAEKAFEWLWLCLQLQKTTTKRAEEIRTIISEVSGFLSIKGYELKSQMDRILSFTEEG